MRDLNSDLKSLKSTLLLIRFVYKLMIGSSKNNRENYPRKCFWTQEKKNLVKFNPGLSANRPSNNWALDPKFLLLIQSYYFGSKVITPDPKLLSRIQSYYSGSKVITPDPKFFLWIQRYYSGSKVPTLDPRFSPQIQRSNPV